MLSRSASLDSIATQKHDAEMISRPSSVESIHNFNRDLSFRQPIKLIKPKTTVDVKPKQPLIETVNTIKTNDKPLTAAAKAVLKNKEAKTVKPKAVKTITPPTTSLSKSIEEQIVKKRAAAARAAIKTKQQEQIIKKKTAAAKADKKTKQQEQVVKWRSKSEDVEMIAPVVIGKRKKDVGLKSEAKTKKEN